MAKHIQLNVPEPCHENWNKMTPSEKGRFCNSCQKQVVDFTGMSDTQLATFFKKSTGSVCGRFMQDQLNRDMDVPKKRIPWVKYFFQFALPAFLFSAKAKAQGNVRVLTGDTVLVPQPLKGKVLATSSTCANEQSTENKTIKGRVIDNEGTGIAYASIFVKGTKIGTMADSIGIFQIRYKGDKNKIVLEASCIGFQSIEKEIDIKRNNESNIIMKPAYSLAGEVVIIAGIVARTESAPKKRKSLPMIPQKLFDTTLHQLKLFPNPLQSGSKLNIELTKTIKEGFYTLDIINQSGQSVYQREIWIDAEAGLLNLDIPFIKPATYFLRLTGKKSKKYFTEKLIIQ